VSTNHVTINADAALRDPDSVFAHFQKLIRLRHDGEVVREGRFELLLRDHEQIWTFTRTLGNERLLIIANCLSDEVAIPAEALPNLDGADLILGTHTPATGRLAA